MIASVQSIARATRDKAARAFSAEARWWTLAQIVLIAALIVQLARLALGFVPQPASVALPSPVPAPPTDLSVFGRFDAFYRTGSQATAAATNAYRLFGLRSGGRDGGSAIIGLVDGRQISVGVGEEVEPGVVLRDVGPDFALLDGSGGVVRIAFPDGSEPSPSPVQLPQSAPLAPATPTSNDTEPTPQIVDPARLLGQASLRPRMDGLRMNGVVVSAGGDGSALRTAGLESGDVILSVNGVELNSPAALGGLRARLISAASAEIRFERDGQTMTTNIRTGR